MKKLFLALLLIGFLALYCNDQLLDAVNSVRLKIALDNLNRFCENIEVGMNIGLTTVGIFTYREWKKMGATGLYSALMAFSLVFLLGTAGHSGIYCYKAYKTKRITKNILESSV